MSASRVVVLVYGFINVLGGFIGYSAAGSMSSLIVGGAVGLALVIAASMVPSKPGLGFRLAGILTFGLIVFWGYRIFEVTREGKKVMNPLMNLVLAVAVLGYLTYAHFSATKRRSSSIP